MRDLQRTPPGQRRRGGDVGTSIPDVPMRPTDSIPAGAIVHEDEDGGEFIELPEYVGPTFEETDFSDFDYDDLYDDVGDEDEDSYGEDA
jgi:hypothetical protein